MTSVIVFAGVLGEFNANGVKPQPNRECIDTLVVEFGGGAAAGTSDRFCARSRILRRSASLAATAVSFDAALRRARRLAGSAMLLFLLLRFFTRGGCAQALFPPTVLQQRDGTARIVAARAPQAIAPPLPRKQPAHARRCGVSIHTCLPTWRSRPTRGRQPSRRAGGPRRRGTRPASPG